MGNNCNRQWYHRGKCFCCYWRSVQGHWPHRHYWNEISNLLLWWWWWCIFFIDVLFMMTRYQVISCRCHTGMNIASLKQWFHWLLQWHNSKTNHDAAQAISIEVFLDLSSKWPFSQVHSLLSTKYHFRWKQHRILYCCEKKDILMFETDFHQYWVDFFLTLLEATSIYLVKEGKVTEKWKNDLQIFCKESLATAQKKHISVVTTRMQDQGKTEEVHVLSLECSIVSSNNCLLGLYFLLLL